MKEILEIIVSEKKFIGIFLGGTGFFFGMFLLIQNSSEVLSILTFKEISLQHRLPIVISSLIDTSDFISVHSWILVILTSIISSVNVTLGYIYFKKVGRVRVSDGIKNGVSLLAVILGIGCSACGGVTLVLIMSAVGGGYVYTQYFSLVGYVGVLVLMFGTYSLTKALHVTGFCIPSELKK